MADDSEQDVQEECRGEVHGPLHVSEDSTSQIFVVGSYSSSSSFASSPSIRPFATEEVEAPVDRPPSEQTSPKVTAEELSKAPVESGHRYTAQHDQAASESHLKAAVRPTSRYASSATPQSTHHEWSLGDSGIRKQAASSPLSPVVHQGRMSPPSSGDVSPPSSQQQQLPLQQTFFDTAKISTSSSTSSSFAGVLKNLARGGSRPTLHSTASVPITGKTSLATPAHQILNRTLSKAGRRSPPPSSAGLQLNIQENDVFQHYEQLRPGQPLPQRVLAADALRHRVEDFALKDIMGIWAAAKLLTDTKLPTEARQAGFNLLLACVRHAHPSPLERRQFFETLSAPCNPDDFHLQLVAMVELTGNGKEISAFEGVLMPTIVPWLTDWFKASVTARKKEKDKGSKSTGVSGEETNLNQIFDFISNLIGFSFNAFKESEVQQLLDQVLYICRTTVSSTDINNSLGIFRALIKFGKIPRPQLEPCLEIMCGSFLTVKDADTAAWTTITYLCKSHLAQVTVVCLLTIARSPSVERKRNINTVRGAVAILDRIIKSPASEQPPTIRLSTLMSAYEKALQADNVKVESQVVLSIEGMLSDDKFRRLLLQEDDWSVMLKSLGTCAKRMEADADDRAAGVPSRLLSKATKEAEYVSTIAQKMPAIIAHLEMIHPKGNPMQRADIMDFFMTMHRQIPDTAASALIDYYIEEHMCFPSNADWLVHIFQLVDNFFYVPSRSTAIRLQVLTVIMNLYQTITNILETVAITEFLAPIFESATEEQNDAVLEKLIGFAVEVAYQADYKCFDLILQALHQRGLTEGAADTAVSSPHSASSASASRSNSAGLLGHTRSSLAPIAAQGIVRIFLQTLDVSADKAVKAFVALIDVASSKTCDPEARLCALRLLFRLRSDGAYSIRVTQDPECERMAAVMNRVHGSPVARRLPEEPTNQRHSKADETASARSSRGTSIAQQTGAMSRSTTRTPSGTFRVIRPAIPLWWYPDALPLPIGARGLVSHLIYSTDERPDDLSVTLPEGEIDLAVPGPTMVLPIGTWLELLINILQRGADWEIYSFVLVHLGSQLTNHTLFAGATPQIKTLRTLICEQIKNLNFQEPPPLSGLKKADVMTGLFHILTMLLSYHRHFNKNEEDEIVRTFIIGVGYGEGTATCCIHALATCCHELPLSLTKSLNAILQKMTQIITQSHIAVHILELLGGLARMPQVYVNLREDEHRKVFGICFRYLQSVRDQRVPGSGATSVRTSFASGLASSRQSVITTRDTPSPGELAMPNAADDLPQYVYALAYHVISFWFLSLKLPDRAKHVSWIIKNLIPTDAGGRETMDEQSLVTIDLLQRVTYSDLDETLADPTFASGTEGTVSTRSWVIGSSILTIDTDRVSGLSQITKRQPSVTTHWIYKAPVDIRPAHQTRAACSTVMDTTNEALPMTVLPNHILLQLTSTSTRTPESVRPIPLPSDEATARALRSLDRNSTVDGHKVGVIYIDEGQTEEAEILANVMGSVDYTEFLEGIGTLVRLRGAKFNTAGLDREGDADGEFAFCWRDRVTEIVFHVTTMMPTNLEHDPGCNDKKRHTGNDFVNVIFNNSGRPFRFETFPSDFNFVNIVITPASRTTFIGRGTDSFDMGKQFYQVQVLSRPGFPEISPAADTKIVSAGSLPTFVRLLALNASVFSLIWANREGGEYVSSWRNRLREIIRLREKHAITSSSAQSNNGNATTPSASSVPASAGVTESVGIISSLLSSRDSGSTQRESLTMRRGSAAFFSDSSSLGHRALPSLAGTVSSAPEMTTTTHHDERGSLADGYDFSKWAS